MKLVGKLWLALISLVCITFSVGGYILVQTLFNDTLMQEISLAKQENRLTRFSLIKAAQTLAPNQEIDNDFYDGIGSMALFNEQQEVIFSNNGVEKINELENTLQVNQANYQLAHEADKYDLYYTSKFIFNNKAVTLVTQRDITTIFNNRARQLALLKTIIIILVAVDAVVILVITIFLTKQMRKVIILEENLQKQRQFASSFTHEIKTPLTAIIGYAELLRLKKNSPERTLMAANYIYEEGKRLEKLSIKLLQLIVLDRQELEWQKINLKSFVQQQIDFMREELNKHDISWWLDVEETIIVGDKDLLKTVLVNLIDNAKKAIGSNGAIIIRGQQKSGQYHLEIIDNGQGIPRAQLEKVTEAFYKIDKSRKKDGSFGLGLAIVKKILGLHRARLEIKSEINKGTIIRIVFNHEE